MRGLESVDPPRILPCNAPGCPPIHLVRGTVGSPCVIPSRVERAIMQFLAIDDYSFHVAACFRPPGERLGPVKEISENADMPICTTLLRARDRWPSWLV